jgi:hypothetical protein
VLAGTFVAAAVRWVNARIFHDSSSSANRPPFFAYATSEPTSWIDSSALYVQPAPS